MRTNATITVYNKHIDSRSAEYQRTIITGVVWQNVRAANKLRSGGDIAANKVTIYIPKALGANYIEPKEWQALSNKTGKWTLQSGDYVVRGTATETISASFTITDLKAKYNDVLAISEIDPHLYGSLRMQHWQVGAK